MFSRSAVPTELPAPTAERRASRCERSGHAGDAATDAVASRPLSALAFAARCHAGQRRESDGAPFTEHLSEVARVLRDAGCAEVLVTAGLLHSVVQDTEVSAAELGARFGATVSKLVVATTDDCVGSYPQRMHALREQVRAAGRDAALLFAANEIAEVRELADQVRRQRARVGPRAAPDRARDRVERYQQMRLVEYRASLAMLRGAAPEHRLVRQLAHELDDCPLCVRRANRVGAAPTTSPATSPAGPERARLTTPPDERGEGRLAVHPGSPSPPGPGDRGATVPARRTVAEQDVTC